MPSFSKQFFNNLSTFNYNKINRMLQNNYLFRRIENKNVFKTFSRGYNRPFRSKIQKRSKLNSSNTIDLMLTNQNIGQRKYNFSSNSQREHQFASKCENSAKKYITDHMEDSNHGLLLTSNTVPLNEVKSTNLSNFKEISNDNLLTRYENSESMRINWNLRRKNQEFKLKSCLRKQKSVYDGQTDQSEFSTLYINQNATTIRDKIANFKKIKNIRANSNMCSQIVPYPIKKIVRMPNFSKLICSEMKKNVEETKSMTLRPYIPM